MPVRSFLIAPDARLQRVCEDVAAITPPMRDLITDMIDTMHAADCIGLAASHFGALWRIAVIDVRDDDATPNVRVFINPVITPLSSQKVAVRTGCLSLPKAYALVERHTHIAVQYHDLEHNVHNAEFTGLAAACLQHQVDHLNGVLFIDRLPKLQRSLLLEKCEKIKRRQ